MSGGSGTILARNAFLRPIADVQASQSSITLTLWRD